jgi:hypothetical protein
MSCSIAFMGEDVAPVKRFGTLGVGAIYIDDYVRLPNHSEAELVKLYASGLHQGRRDFDYRSPPFNSRLRLETGWRVTLDNWTFLLTGEHQSIQAWSAW